MKRFKSAILGLVFIASTFTGVMAQNSAEGSLTVAGTTTAIKHIYFDQYRDEFTIIVTDNPIAPAMIPDGVYGLSEHSHQRLW